MQALEPELLIAHNEPAGVQFSLFLDAKEVCVTVQPSDKDGIRVSLCVMGLDDGVAWEICGNSAVPEAAQFPFTFHSPEMILLPYAEEA